MKHQFMFVSIISLSLYSQIGLSGSIADPEYTKGETLTAAKMNNIRNAINENDADITNNASIINTNSIDITNLQNGISPQPGVKTFETAGGIVITDTAELLTLTVTIPDAGNVIVYASGSLFLNVAGVGQQLVRLKVSKTSADTSETPGIQSIRSSSILTGMYVYPFSIVKVFTEPSAGTYTYYLNGWHQVTQSTAVSTLDDATFSALYIPATLP